MTLIISQTTQIIIIAGAVALLAAFASFVWHNENRLRRAKK